MDADSSPELAMSPSPYFPFNGEGWDRRHEAALGSIWHLVRLTCVPRCRDRFDRKRAVGAVDVTDSLVHTIQHVSNYVCGCSGTLAPNILRTYRVLSTRLCKA